MKKSPNYTDEFATANGLKGNSNAKKPKDLLKTAQISAFVTPKLKGELVLIARKNELPLSAIIERVMSEWLIKGNL
jgi:hypothetical protein